VKPQELLRQQGDKATRGGNAMQRRRRRRRRLRKRRRSEARSSQVFLFLHLLSS
jgi:hypothetical protein